MIKQRVSLGFSLLWRTYVVYFIYTLIFSLVLGFVFTDLVYANKDLLLFAPAFALGLFGLLLAILEVGCRVNLLRVVFGGRLKRSPAQWRTYALQLALVLGTLGTLNALIAVFAPVDIWLYYKAYGGPLLFVMSVFAIGWAQATPSTAPTSATPDARKP